MAKTQISTFAVRGKGDFPMDMLRYDMAYPASEQDSWVLSQRGDRTVHLKVMHLSTMRVVTPGRWESFGWTVTEGPRLLQDVK